MSQKARQEAKRLGLDREPEPAKPMSASELLSALDLTESAVANGLVKRFSHFSDNGPIMVWGEPVTPESWEAEAVRCMSEIQELNAFMLADAGLVDRKDSKAQPTIRRGRELYIPTGREAERTSDYNDMAEPAPTPTGPPRLIRA